MGTPDFARAYELDDDALWRAQRARASERCSTFMRSRGVARARSTRTRSTIGFARRFATYKRADLLFSDPDRLARLLGDAERPLQIVDRRQGPPRRRGRQGR